METAVAVVSGAAIALLGAFPTVWALELGLRGDDRATIVRGLVGIIISFFISSALLLMAHLLLGETFRSCGVAFVVVLVATWSVETVRAYVSM